MNRRGIVIVMPVVARCSPPCEQPDTSLVPRAAVGWPTNGGNWYNQRYSPLTEIDREQRRESQRRVAHAARRIRCRPAVLRRSAAARRRRRHLRADGRERFVRARRRNRSDSLVVQVGPRSRDRRRLLRLDEPRRRARQRPNFLGQTRRAARRARREDRRRRVDRASRALARRLLAHERAALLRRSRHHGLRGRRARRARPRQSVRRRERRARLDLLYDSGPRRARQRDLAAGQRALAARRRHGLAHAGRRSGARPHLLLDGQSGPRLQRQPCAQATTSTRRRSSPWS